MLKSDASSIAWSTAIVTSVGLSAPAIFTVSGSPVNSAGTLALALATQNANLIFAGPVSGGAAAPTFRALVDADGAVLKSGTQTGIAGDKTFTGNCEFSAAGVGSPAYSVTVSGARLKALGFGIHGVADGASGTFTTVDLKTVTVTNGIITSIV